MTNNLDFFFQEIGTDKPQDVDEQDSETTELLFQNLDKIPTVKGDKENISRPRSLASALGRGLIKGVQQFGRALGPLIPQTLEEARQIEEFPRQVEEFLPTQDLPVERILERGGEVFPFVATGGGGGLEAILRSAGAGGLREAAKEMGAGEFGQSIAELPALLTPRIGGTRIQPRASEESLLEFARKQGLSEQEALLSVRDQGFEKVFEKIAPKGARTQEPFIRTRQALNRVYDTIENSPSAKTPLTEVNSSKLINNMSNKLQRIPSETRNKILVDFQDLIGTEMNGQNIMDFVKKVRSRVRKGDRVLGVLESDLQDALKSIDPELATDFGLTTQLYKRFSTNYNNIKPSTANAISDNLVSLGESGLLMTGLMQGDVGLLTASLGTLAGRELARQMVVNPRLHNIFGKLLTAVKNNQFGIAESLKDKFALAVEEINPEAAVQIKEYDLETVLKRAKEKEEAE